MNTKQKSVLLLPFAVYTGLPILLFPLGSYPDRDLIKELISLAVILAFCLATAQFYWSATNRSLRKSVRIGQLRYTHEILGYLCIILLAVHPLLLVVPLFYSGSIDPLEALTTILTTTSNRGIVLGITAWLTMVTLGATSLMRSKLPWGYQTWKKCHGILAMLFILTSVWHAVDLGRHTDAKMSGLLVALAASGIGLWLFNTLSPVNQYVRRKQ